MIKVISAAALIAAAWGSAPGFAATGYDYNAQSYGDPAYNSRYQGDSQQYGAFNRLGCPPGSVIESFPNGNGQRCALPGGGYRY